MSQIKQIGKILKTSGTPFTGQTQRMVSPLTGKLTTYVESYRIYVTTPAPATPDINTLKTQINSDLLSQSVDGVCDEILVIQGVTNDTYRPRVWIAEEQTAIVATYGVEPLIAPIVAALIVAMIISVTIAVVIVVVVLTQSFTAIGKMLLQPPQYVGGTPDNPVTYDNYAQYLSSQHNLYWYVCPKCGAGFGLKTAYPNITDVPQAEKDAFDEHVNMCLGIPTGPQNVTAFIIYAGIAVVGVIVAMWTISKVLSGRKERKHVYLPPPPPRV